MKVFLLVLVLVTFCVVGLCFNIIFRKDGQFPETEIENNREMKKLGIKCAKAEEMALYRKSSSANLSCSGDEQCGSCAGCNFYDKK